MPINIYSATTGHIGEWLESNDFLSTFFWKLQAGRSSRLSSIQIYGRIQLLFDLFQTKNKSLNQRYIIQDVFVYVYYSKSHYSRAKHN